MNRGSADVASCLSSEAESDLPQRTLFGIADALATVGVEQVGRGHVAAADGWIAFERNAN